MTAEKLDLADLRAKADAAKEEAYWEQFVTLSPDTILALLDVIAERDATIAAALAPVPNEFGHPRQATADEVRSILAASDSSALTERDRAVAERAWEEGSLAGWDESTGNNFLPNPYAKEAPDA